MGGPTGLDYNVVFHMLDRMKLDDLAYDQLFEDVRVLEEAALLAMRAPS